MMAARHLRKDGFEVYNIIGGVYYYMKEKNKISQRLSMLQKLTVDEK